MAHRRIVLCADDYGYSPGVSRGILELLQQERLSATSCMVVFPEFADDGPLLKPFLDRADVGLHFTLTTDRPLKSVALEAHLRPPPVSTILVALEYQLEIFETVIGRPPVYIDGHQHVHVLPVIREAVVNVAGRIGAYVRDTREPIGPAMLRRPAPLESIYLARASRALSKLARDQRVATNRGFRGVRTFRETGPFRTLFRRMIKDVRNASIIMCHPGHADSLLGERDPVQNAREDELAYLACPDFLRDLEEEGVALSRMAEALAANGSR